MQTLTQTTEFKVSENAQRVISLLNQAIEKSITAVSFVSVRNYTNKNDETANYLFNLGVNYEKAIQDDIKFLQNLDVTTLTDVKSSVADLAIAKAQLIESFISPNENRSNGQKNAYTPIGLKGLKVHNESGLLYVWGFLQNKTVTVKGTYKEVKSSNITIAKNELKKLLKSGKFRMFSIAIGNTIKASGETLEL